MPVVLKRSHRSSFPSGEVALLTEATVTEYGLETTAGEDSKEQPFSILHPYPIQLKLNQQSKGFLLFSPRVKNPARYKGERQGFK